MIGFSSNGQWVPIAPRRALGQTTPAAPDPSDPSKDPYRALQEIVAQACQRICDASQAIQIATFVRGQALMMSEWIEDDQDSTFLATYATDLDYFMRDLPSGSLHEDHRRALCKAMTEVAYVAIAASSAGDVRSGPVLQSFEAVVGQLLGQTPCRKRGLVLPITLGLGGAILLSVGLVYLVRR